MDRDEAAAIIVNTLNATVEQAGILADSIVITEGMSAADVEEAARLEMVNQGWTPGVPDDIAGLSEGGVENVLQEIPEYKEINRSGLTPLEAHDKEVEVLEDLLVTYEDRGVEIENPESAEYIENERNLQAVARELSKRDVERLSLEEAETVITNHTGGRSLTADQWEEYIRRLDATVEWKVDSYEDAVNILLSQGNQDLALQILDEVGFYVGDGLADSHNISLGWQNGELKLSSDAWAVVQNVLMPDFDWNNREAVKLLDFVVGDAIEQGLPEEVWWAAVRAADLNGVFEDTGLKDYRSINEDLGFAPEEEDIFFDDFGEGTTDGGRFDGRALRTAADIFSDPVRDPIEALRDYRDRRVQRQKAAAFQALERQTGGRVGSYGQPIVDPGDPGYNFFSDAGRDRVTGQEARRASLREQASGVNGLLVDNYNDLGGEGYELAAIGSTVDRAKIDRILRGEDITEEDTAWYGQVAGPLTQLSAAEAQAIGLNPDTLVDIFKLGLQRRGGSGSGSGGAAVRLPDPAKLKDAARELHAAWGFSDPTDEELGAVVEFMNGKVTADAGANRTTDIAASLKERLRGTKQYQLLMGEKLDGYTEEQWAGQFSNVGGFMLGGELTPIEHVQAGMRTGSAQTTIGSIAGSKESLQNSSFQERIALAAQAINRFT